MSRPPSPDWKCLPAKSHGMAHLCSPAKLSHQGTPQAKPWKSKAASEMRRRPRAAKSRTTVNLCTPTGVYSAIHATKRCRNATPLQPGPWPTLSWEITHYTDMLGGSACPSSRPCPRKSRCCHAGGLSVPSVTPCYSELRKAMLMCNPIQPGRRPTRIEDSLTAQTRWGTLCPLSFPWPRAPKHLVRPSPSDQGLTGSSHKPRGRTWAPKNRSSALPSCHSGAQFPQALGSRLRMPHPHSPHCMVGLAATNAGPRGRGVKHREAGDFELNTGKSHFLLSDHL
jgi:hypothetical protein